MDDTDIIKSQIGNNENQNATKPSFPLTFGETERTQLFQIIFEKSFRTGNFTLASGKKSNLYFNLKPTMMTARGAELSALAFLTLMQKHALPAVSGLEMGAVPIIGAMAALSSVTDAPIYTSFVRKSVKSHGTKAAIEGLDDINIQGIEFFIIDDVATTAGSLLKAINAIRDSGGIVRYAGVLVNRHEGGDELMRDHNVELLHIYEAHEFLK